MTHDNDNDVPGCSVLGAGQCIDSTRLTHDSMMDDTVAERIVTSERLTLRVPYALCARSRRLKGMRVSEHPLQDQGMPLPLKRLPLRLQQIWQLQQRVQR